jgi:(heptosyl)LPS beta-1,4-glucosyltransferase
VRPRFWAPLAQPLRQFRWRFLTLEGYRDGWRGLLLSVLMAYYDVRVYRRLRTIVRSRGG